MGLRPARIYRAIQRAWTRTARRKVNKAFVKGVPDSRIRSFDMGSPKWQKEGDVEVYLIPSFSCQIRHNALEAARIACNRHMEKHVGKENYYFKVRVFPHQVLREHAMLSGAGADRLSSGMRKAFGKPVGRAAVVKKGQKIMSIYTTKQFEKEAREALRKAGSRMPGTPKVKVEAIRKEEAGKEAAKASA
ncbi:50S ribosomal protein L16 [Candidatus Micrarchaeota archaeon]|nr:MAG: 50S ribosomal protein L16 [Candidatus Micrarchaeota archaeon]